MPSKEEIMNDEWANQAVSKLPEWIITKVGGKLGIQCPSKECHGKALVSRRWLTSRRYYIGRSCTYCFKTFQIPESWRQKNS